MKFLPNDLFVETPKLRWVFFNNNKIERLSSKIFYPLDKKSLETFWMGENTSVSVYFEQDGGTTLEALMKEIDEKCLSPIEDPLIKPRQPPTKSENRFKKYEEYFVTGKFSDFTIKFRGNEYKVHKIVLSSQSSMIDSIVHQRKIKKVKNMSHDAFEDFLRYFYFGTIRSEDNAMVLFGLAVEFDVATLKFACEEIILRYLNEFNMLEVFNLAHFRGSEVLKKAAFAIIKMSFLEISDNKINTPKLVAEIINAKRRLDKLMNAA